MRQKLSWVLALALAALALTATSAAATTVTPGGVAKLSGGLATVTTVDGQQIRCGGFFSPVFGKPSFQISATGVPSGTFSMGSCAAFTPSGTAYNSATIPCKAVTGSASAVPPQLNMTVSCEGIIGSVCILPMSGTIRFDYDNAGNLTLKTSALKIFAQSALCEGSMVGPVGYTISGPVKLSPTQVFTL